MPNNEAVKVIIELCWALEERSLNMVKRKTWITCSHVMNGSAEIVTLRPNRYCACEKCLDDVRKVKTADVHIVEEDRLLGMLKDFNVVNGAEYINRDIELP